ncbi:MAG: chorismate synthase, partial [Bacteroidales bacterium]|nr:chorismate synthase [Bacteroidales bacterium]
TQIGNSSIPKNKNTNLNTVNTNPLRCPDVETSKQMMKLLHQIASKKDSIGAQVMCKVENLPIGLGEPVFDKLNADLSKALMSIPAAKGIEFGIGFDAARMKGSEYNDLYKENFKTHTNHAGGIQAGISNGEILYFSMAFKPIPSIMKDQQSINKQGEKAIYKAGGRHDICVVPRVLSIVEAMTALVLADHLLRNKIN